LRLEECLITIIQNKMINKATGYGSGSNSASNAPGTEYCKAGHPILVGTKNR